MGQPDWVCQDCGIKYGEGQKSLSCWHIDTCGVCGKEKPCTEPRDFLYLRETWMNEKPALIKKKSDPSEAIKSLADEIAALEYPEYGVLKVWGEEL